MGSYTLMLVVHPSIPAKSVKELIAYAKANPGKLTYASGNTSGVVAGETLKHWAKLDMLHVPYKSAPPALNDLLAGRVSMMFNDFTTSLPHVKAESACARWRDAHQAQRAVPGAADHGRGRRHRLRHGFLGRHLRARPIRPPAIVTLLNTELRKIIDSADGEGEAPQRGLRGVLELAQGAGRIRQGPARQVGQDGQGRRHPAGVARPPLVGFEARHLKASSARTPRAEPENAMRPSRRQPDELRAVSLERGVVKYAEGSCFVKFGDTHVLVTATLEDRLPPWLKGQARGWVTAEYGMLPRATHERTRREASAGKQGGRTVEIQRLIGRSLRSVVDLEALGERQITVDCDVIQADGGTRTASITGAWVALHDCLAWMKTREMIKAEPLRDHVAAISCGVYQNVAVLDLDYAEDSEAETDANFVMTGTGNIVEVQATAEKTPFSEAQLSTLLALARRGIGKLVDLQKMAVM